MRRQRRRAVHALLSSALILGLTVAVEGTAGAGEESGPVVNVALLATASATSETAGHAAALAVDGDGATTWCPAADSGAVTVDLGRPRRVEGFGVTLMGTAGGVRVDGGPSPNRLRALASLPSAAANTPIWLPAKETARFVRVTVTGGACLGETRVLARTARGLALGDDLSFAVQEAAIG